MKKVSTTWSNEADRGLVGLHHDEDANRISAASVEWDRGSIDPCGGLFNTSFFFQFRPTDEQLPGLLHAIADGWLTGWYEVEGKQPILLIERDGDTAGGEPIAYDIVGERIYRGEGGGSKLTVKLPIQEDHLLGVDGWAYRRMGIDRQHDQYTNLLPILPEVVEGFNFPTTQHKPSQDVPMAVVCISPMQVLSGDHLFAVLEQAVELGCSLTLSLSYLSFPKRIYASVCLERIENEWVMTTSVVGGSPDWRDRQIEWVNSSFAHMIPSEARVTFSEKYSAPRGKIGQALEKVWVAIAAPLAAIRAAVAKACTVAFSPLTNALEQRRQAREARNQELMALFRAVGLAPQKKHTEACFLAIDRGVERDPEAATVELRREKAALK